MRQEQVGLFFCISFSGLYLKDGFFDKKSYQYKERDDDNTLFSMGRGLGMWEAGGTWIARVSSRACLTGGSQHLARNRI